MIGFVAFLVVHVTLVIMTGFARNMNHIVMGSDDTNTSGMMWGFVGIGVVIASWIVAHYLSWMHPRALQRAVNGVTYPMQLITLNRLNPHQRYGDRDVSPFFWPNGKLPQRPDWNALAERGFQDFRLVVGVLVAHPLEISLADLKQLGFVEHVTMHHCIQGWTGIAKWGGVPMAELIRLVRPLPAAKVVAFISFGEALYGGAYYDTQRLENVLKPACILAIEMNGGGPDASLQAPPGCGSRISLLQMVKWVERIEFIESEKKWGKVKAGRTDEISSLRTSEALGRNPHRDCGRQR